MKDISSKFMKTFTEAALWVAKINANTSCVCIMHQPKPPVALKALKK